MVYALVDFVADIVELKCSWGGVILCYKARFCVSPEFSQLFLISQDRGVFLLVSW
ncbi:hypothetical protein IFVP182_C260005 [Vibrio parahaemolyticus]